MENKISAALTPTNVTDFKTSVDDTKALLTFLVSLSAEVRDSLRVLGPKRQGYVNAVYVGLNSNLSSIPSTFDMDEFTKDMNLLLSLEDLVGYVTYTLLQTMQDTEMQLRHEMMAQADIGYSILKLAAKNGDDHARMAVADIAALLKQAGHKPDEVTYDIPAAGEATVNNTVPKSKFVNLGDTVLEVDPDPELMGAPRNYRVSPGNSYELPNGFTGIHVRNVSQDKEGKFSVKVIAA